MTIRVLVAMAVLLQSLVGLGAARCASAAGAAPVTVGRTCGCCGDGGASDCPFMSEEGSACGCAAAPSTPKPAPRPDDREIPAQRLAALLPPVEWAGVDAALGHDEPRWRPVERVPRSGGRSIQSLLCVWLT